MCHPASVNGHCWNAAGTPSVDHCAEQYRSVAPGHALERRQEPGFELAVGEVRLEASAATALGFRLWRYFGAGQLRSLAVPHRPWHRLDSHHDHGRLSSPISIRSSPKVSSAQRVSRACNTESIRATPVKEPPRQYLRRGNDLVSRSADSHAELGQENSDARPEEYPWMQSSPIINRMLVRLLIDGLGGNGRINPQGWYAEWIRHR